MHKNKTIMIQRGSRRLRKYFSALYICASIVRSETPTLVMEQEELANVGLKNRRHQC